MSLVGVGKENSTVNLVKDFKANLKLIQLLLRKPVKHSGIAQAPTVEGVFLTFTFLQYVPENPHAEVSRKVFWFITCSKCLHFIRAFFSTHIYFLWGQSFHKLDDCVYIQTATGAVIQSVYQTAHCQLHLVALLQYDSCLEWRIKQICSVLVVYYSYKPSASLPCCFSCHAGK